MSYRKIVVSGNAYEYVIGKTHVKVKGVGLFLKSEWGNPIDRYSRQTRELYTTYVITPDTVRRIILGEKPSPREFVCTRHNTRTTRLAFDPYAYEICNTSILVKRCEECLRQSAMDI
jgi:hypothetical protein